jgi:hypothetical protein
VQLCVQLAELKARNAELERVVRGELEVAAEQPDGTGTSPGHVDTVH